MGNIGRIIEEGDYPHSADWLSISLSDSQLGFVIEGEYEECKVNIDGDDVTVGDGWVWFGDTGETRKFNSDSITPSASEEEGHRYDLLCITKGNGGAKLEYKEGERIVYDPEAGEIPKHPDIKHPIEEEIEIPIAILHFAPFEDSITKIKDCRTVRQLNSRDPHGNDDHTDSALGLEVLDEGTVNIDTQSSETINLSDLSGYTEGDKVSVFIVVRPYFIEVDEYELSENVRFTHGLNGTKEDEEPFIEIRNNDADNNAQVDYQIVKIG